MVRTPRAKKQLQVDRLQKFKKKNATKAWTALDTLAGVVERGENLSGAARGVGGLFVRRRSTGRLQEVVGRFRPEVSGGGATKQAGAPALEKPSARSRRAFRRNCNCLTTSPGGGASRMAAVVMLHSRQLNRSSSNVKEAAFSSASISSSAFRSSRARPRATPAPGR